MRASKHGVTFSTFSFSLSLLIGIWSIIYGVIVSCNFFYGKRVTVNVKEKKSAAACIRFIENIPRPQLPSLARRCLHQLEWPEYYSSARRQAIVLGRARKRRRPCSHKRISIAWWYGEQFGAVGCCAALEWLALVLVSTPSYMIPTPPVVCHSNHRTQLGHPSTLVPVPYLPD